MREAYPEPKNVRRPTFNHGVIKTCMVENNTGVPLYVTGPTGEFFSVSPRNTVNEGHAVTIYVTYRVTPGMGSISGLSDTLPLPAYQQLCKDVKEYGEGTLAYTLDDPSELIRGRAVKMHATGHILSTTPVDLSTMVNAKPHCGSSDIGVGVIVVQKHGSKNELKWVRYFNTLIEVNPVRAKFYEEGIYMVLYNGEIVEGTPLLRFAFDDPLSPFRAFESERDARTFSWARQAIPSLAELKDKLEKEIAKTESSYQERKNALELEHRAALNELNIEKERTASFYRDMEMKTKEDEARRKEEMERRSAERKDWYEERSAERKDRSEDRKDWYEERSSGRKDKTEAYKFIPSLLAAGVSLLTFLVKA
ncbi:MAG: hypothetical protein ACRDBQ_18725 [Shewanella sp.]